MSIKVKLTAVAIATASSALSFSVPSQASEYGYLNIIKIDAEQMSEQEGVNHYLDKLNVSEKLERGKEYCKALEGKTMEKVIRSLGPKVYNLSQQGYSERAIDGFINTQLSMLYASAKELCPEYEYKLDIFQSKHSGEKQI